MAWTIESALDDPDIDLVFRDDDLGIYRFTVGTLETEVEVVVSRLPQSEHARYERSHDIKTKGMATPYRQSRPYWDYPAYALHQAVSSLTDNYRQAVRAGHQPRGAWLVPNRS